MNWRWATQSAKGCTRLNIGEAYFRIKEHPLLGRMRRHKSNHSVTCPERRNFSTVVPLHGMAAEPAICALGEQWVQEPPTIRCKTARNRICRPR